MKKILVVPSSPVGEYVVEVTSGGDMQAGVGSIPKAYSIDDLPSALIRTGVPETTARRAAERVDKDGSWICDLI